MANQIRLTLVLIIFASQIVGGETGCVSPQYLEIGRPGTIVCSFVEGFNSIHWYYDLEETEGPPTISYSNEGVSGDGFDSGEFNIRPDGSLIINNVTVEHEVKFIAVEVKTLQDTPISSEINIHTIVQPTPLYPVVDDCLANEGVCYIAWGKRSPLQCRIQHSRPAIPLSWIARTVEGDVQVTNETVYSKQDNTWSSSISVADPFIYSSYLALLVCKADDQPKLLKKVESMIFLHKNDKDTSKYETAQRAVERRTKVQLPCTDVEYQLLVWERISTSGNASLLAFDAVATGDTFVDTNEYEILEGSLSIADVHVHHEGSYRCTYSDGIVEGVKTVNLTVYVPPVPEYPVIEGCNHKQYCTLGVGYEGQLTCSVKRIRPEVNLEWRVFHKESADMISFHDQQIKGSYSEDTFDVSLTTEFTATISKNNKVTVECRVTGPNAKHFDLYTRIDLLFSGNVDQSSTEEPGTTNEGTILSVIVTGIVIVILVLLVIGLVIVIRKWKAWRNHATLQHTDEEQIQMVQKKEELTKFISQLKSSYENLYSAVKPVPFFDQHFTVHEMYVEGGIEYLSKKNMKHTWKPFNSYKDIFTHSDMPCDRWIIEGEPGYGKSTLSLQLAYEWCHQVDKSFMCTVEIFLLVRLRQLKGVSSIYEAIKRFILPKDSKFTVDNIKGFIDNSSTVLIILDGFDEYPDNESVVGDVFSIMTRIMLPKCKVVLTTRSKKLPKGYAPQTNRLRLTGFKGEEQEQYLQKAITLNGDNSAEITIKEWLASNPILSDLCEVPLFFVMYAHLSLDSNDLKNCTSVTSFFRYMITCLHSHLKLKLRNENVDSVAFNENFHEDLDKLCFESLNGHSYNPDIEKDIIIKTLGKEFLENYLKIGIFREEKTTRVANKPGIQASEHVKDVPSVRFYHSLFCEWYASHYLADALDKIRFNPGQSGNDHNLTLLEDLDPSHLQYVFRFACGIKPRAAQHILQYLKINHEGYESFAILCILEQAGNIDAIIDNVRDICSNTEGLQLRFHDNKILQRSVIKLLAISASKEIIIPKLLLNESFKLVDLSRNEIMLSSDVHLPVLTTVNELWLEQKGIQFKQKELADIFQYISKCKNLTEICFAYSLLPFEVNERSALIQRSTEENPAHTPISTEIKVLWYPSEVWYSLDLKSGRWQHVDSSLQLDIDDYNSVKSTWKDMNE